jgi:hypothetical protein
LLEDILVCEGKFQIILAGLFPEWEQPQISRIKREQPQINHTHFYCTFTGLFRLLWTDFLKLFLA